MDFINIAVCFHVPCGSCRRNFCAVTGDFLLTENWQFPYGLWRASFNMKQSHRNGFNRAGKFIFRLKVPLQYPMRYTILIRRHLKLLMTDRKTSWLYGVTLNLNIMAHFQKNRKKRTMNPERMFYMIKILPFKSEDFIHSCGPTLHLLAFQQSRNCAAPKLSRNSSKTWSTSIETTKQNIPSEVLNFLR